MEPKEKVSKLTEKLLISEQSLSGVSENLEICRNKLEKSEKAREKWYGLYLAQREASKRDKQERAEFAKRATIAEGKYVPKHNFLKRIHQFILNVDLLLK